MFRRRSRVASGTPATPAAPVHLEATGVGKDIDGAVLLAPTSLAVRSGECVVLRGANGSGKTTLLRVLSGALEPSTGEARLDGTPVDERDPRTRAAVAALIGAPTAYRDLTVVDHLVLVDSTWGGRIDTADERADELLTTLEIDHLAERFPHELSSGQQQLFHLALVLFRPAGVLVLDEPEQRLDTHKRELLTSILVARKAAGTALVVACHDPVMTEALADRVVDVSGA
jgi:ABC-type multidrug transport system ATPase subunit